MKVARSVREGGSEKKSTVEKNKITTVDFYYETILLHTLFIYLYFGSVRLDIEQLLSSKRTAGLVRQTPGEYRESMRRARGKKNNRVESTA